MSGVSASYPRVMRTQIVSTGALIAEGHMFADGKRRIFVPETTPDELIAELAAALVEADEKAERLARGIAAVEALMSRPNKWSARRHSDPYCATHCSPGGKHSQCGCPCDHRPSDL